MLIKVDGQKVVIVICLDAGFFAHDICCCGCCYWTVILFVVTATMTPSSDQRTTPLEKLLSSHSVTRSLEKSTQCFLKLHTIIALVSFCAENIVRKLIAKNSFQVSMLGFDTVFTC